MLVPTQDMLQQARRSSEPYGVLALNVIGLEHAEAIVQAAEAERSPIIMQISENATRYRGSLAPIAAACRELAKSASVPVALHFDHATSRSSCELAMANKFSSIMFDSSHATLAANIEDTKTITDWAHGHDLSIEGEIGIVGGKNGSVTTRDGLSDPDDVAAYVAQTGIDALAVAIGTEHGMTRKSTRLDLQRLAQIRARVDVPLVLHGSSGVPDDQLTAAIRYGITKVNLATQLNIAYTSTVRQQLKRSLSVVDPRIYGAPARDAMIELIRSQCTLVGSSNRA
jgi:ketose-bisphosphate aldolase